MPAIQVGGKCIKVRGRSAGKTVEVVKVIDSNFVEVKNDKGKIKRCNVLHLEPLP